MVDEADGSVVLAELRAALFSLTFQSKDRLDLSCLCYTLCVHLHQHASACAYASAPLCKINSHLLRLA